MPSAHKLAKHMVESIPRRPPSKSSIHPGRIDAQDSRSGMSETRGAKDIQTNNELGLNARKGIGHDCRGRSDNSSRGMSRTENYSRQQRKQETVIQTRRQDILWLAGLLDGRGVVEVGRYDKDQRRKVLPDIAIDFSVRRKGVADEAARIMGGITKLVRRGRRVQAFVRGWGKVSKLAEELAPLMKDPTKVSRLRIVAMRAREPSPSVCKREEREAPPGKLSEVFFKGCPAPIKD